MADIPTNGSLDGPDVPDTPPEGQVYTTGSLISATPEVTSSKSRVSRRSVIIALLFLLLALLVAGLIFWTLNRSRQQDNNSNANSSVNNRYQSVNVTLGDLSKDGSLVIDSTPSLSINGQLKINNSLIIGPTSPPPADGVAGQIYYDPQLNVLRYFNGSSFTTLLNDETPMVNSLGGAGGNISLGTGLTLANGQLSAAASAVTSVQGRTGSINFTSGGGIAINGTTLSNTGVIGLGGQTGNISLGQGLAINNGSLTNTGVNSLSSGSPTLLIADDGSGNLTITDSNGSSGVTSPGGTTNRLAKFTGAQAIGDSSISDNGTVVSITGDLAVSGSLSLGTLLSVGNGGTGAASLANNGLLLGQGTGPITTVTAGGTGLCLVSTAGAPAFQACPGSGGVISVNSLTGALNIANASGSGATITIDDASTTQKGIAQFNGTNFAVGGGIVNTIQDIGTGATPTFVGVNVTSGYQLNGVGGAAATCSGGQILQNVVVAGGIVTGGSCVAPNVSGVTTVGTFSGSSQVNGASIVGSTITFGPADASNPGMVSTGTQTFAGDKTFNGKLIVGGAPSTYQLEVNAGASNDGIHAVVANDSAWGLLINNSTFGTTDATGFGLWQGDAGTGYIGNNGAGDAIAVAINGDVRAGYVLQANGDIESISGVYKIGGISGTAVTCTGGQLLQNAVVAGGIVTGGSCIAPVTGGVTTIGTIDSQAKSANGAVIVGTSLYFQTADATNPGLVSTGTQTLAGSKTFTGNASLFKPGSNSTTAFQIQPAASSVPVVNVDTTNSYVGIGTASPFVKLDVVGVNGIDAKTRLYQPDGFYAAQVLQSNNAEFSIGVGGSAIGATNSGNLFIYNAGTNTNTLSINGATNNVGISTTGAAAYKLDVAGDINSSGVYRAGGTAGVAITCTGGQLIQNATTVGGIVTGGSCVAPGTAGVTTVGTIDSQTKSANGAVIVGTNIYMQTADATNPGLVSTGTQTFAGAKTFTGAITANSTYNTNTFTGDTLTFGNAAGANINAASGQALTVGGNSLTLSAAAAQAINIGTVNNNTITVGTTTATGTITLGQSTASNIVNVGNGTIAAGNTGTVNVGTSSTSTGKTIVTVGSTNDGSSTTVQAGTGNINLNSVGTTGGTIVKSATSNSTGAFQVQNLSNVAILNYDTTVNRLTLRASSATSSVLSILNSDATTALEVRSGGSGQLNTFVGLNSGASVTSASNNTGFGINVFQNLNSGSYNVGAGMQALSSLTTGTDNTAVGAFSLISNQTGQYNTALGSDAAGHVVTSFNTAVGGAALNTASTGISNTAIGYHALVSANGDYNTTVGTNSGYNLTSGSYNTIIGSDAGSIDSDTFSTPGTLNGSVVIGIQAQAQADNSLILGGTGNQVVNVGIGTTKPDNRLSVSPVIYGAGGLAGDTTTASQSGTTVTGTGTSWTTVGTVKVGQEIIFANGNSAYITSVNSNTSLTVDASQTVGSQRYRIHDSSLQVGYTGSVGIGTADLSSTLYRLDVQNANQDTLMRLYQNDGRFAETVYQTDNADFDVGVGGTNAGASDTGSFFIYDDNDGTYGMSIDGSGNVGVGNLAGNQSTTVLDVNGVIRVRNPNGETTAPTRANNGEFAFADLGSTNQRLYFRTNGTNYFINRSGTGDYSEYFLKQDKNESLKPGHLTTMDSGKVTKATQKNNIIGVVSAYGTRNNDDLNDGLRSQDPAYANVGVLGQLPVIVTNEKGKITAGDPITSSSKQAGIGTKTDRSGMIVGRTTQDFDPESSKCTPINSIESAPWTEIKENASPDAQCFRLPDGTLVGRVLVYVNAQYYTPPMQGNDISNLQTDMKNLGANLQTKKATIGDLKVSGSATINGKLVVRGLTEVQDLQLDGHLITKGGKPTVKLLASTGSVSITGNDSAGTITVVAGANPKADDLVKLTFSKAFGITPQIVVSPIGKISTALEPYVNDPSAKGFTLGSLQAPQAGQTYKFTYYAVQ